MRLRILAVSFIALLFALAQTVLSGVSMIGDANAYAASLDAQRPASVVLQEEEEDDEDDGQDDDEDEDDDEDDGDNEDDDTADDGDTEDEDGDVTDDDDDTADDGSNAPTIDDESLKEPLQVASGTSTGGDSVVAMPGERVVLSMFPWMPAGVQVTLRPVDPNSVTAAPGTRAGDLMFAIEARDASGTQLTSLPAEVNLAIRYADTTIDGLDEGNLTLSRLNPAINQWQSAPKVVREPDSNYVAASITEVGTYVVSTP